MTSTLRCDRRDCRCLEKTSDAQQLLRGGSPRGSLSSPDSGNLTKALPLPPSAGRSPSRAQLSVLSTLSPSITALRYKPTTMISCEVLIGFLETVVVP